MPEGCSIDSFLNLSFERNPAFSDKMSQLRMAIHKARILAARDLHVAAIWKLAQGIIDAVETNSGDTFLISEAYILIGAWSLRLDSTFIAFCAFQNALVFIKALEKTVPDLRKISDALSSLMRLTATAIAMKKVLKDSL